MDEGNSRAKQGLDSALIYSESDSSAAVTGVSQIYLKKNTPQDNLQAGRTPGQLSWFSKHIFRMIELLVCGQLDTMIDEGAPPDLLLDLSHRGEMVKSISLNLGLPTVTSSLGAEKDIRLYHFKTSWRHWDFDLAGAGLVWARPRRATWCRSGPRLTSCPTSWGTWRTSPTSTLRPSSMMTPSVRSSLTTSSLAMNNDIFSFGETL